MKKKTNTVTIPSKIRAAAYIRTARAHRQSALDQLEKIQGYARDHNMEIVHVYADEGKSGLSTEGRDGLARILRDIGTGKKHFEVVLLYDPSRWGRFQDADEITHYEQLCRYAGVDVHYCGCVFSIVPNDSASIPSRNKNTFLHL